MAERSGSEARANKADVVLTVAGVEFSVALTSRPWDLDVQALIISVGRQLGGLAMDVRDHLPELPWDELPFGSIGPGNPQSISTGRPPPDPRQLIVASAHNLPESDEV